MLVQDEIRKCVIFLFYKKNGAYKLAGTGFFFSTEFPDGSNRTLINVITAKHVIAGIAEKSDDNKVWFRVNNKTELAWFDSDISTWLFHPTDETVDVAVNLFRHWDDKNIDQMMLHESTIVTEEIIKAEGIGIGDEIYVAGLFRNHYGSMKNIPIIRIGNISSMREEKVNFRNQAVDAYLIECRSIGGLSGSPVFVNMGLHRRINGEIKSSRGHILRWIGMISGHWDIEEGAVDAVEEGENGKNVNMGRAIAVPVDRIMEVVNQPLLQAAREKAFMSVISKHG